MIEKKQRPELDRPSAGRYPPHRAAVLSRVGDAGDSAGEHAWLEIVACEAMPEAVGSTYRTPIAGGPMWHEPWSDADLLVAREAPHASKSREEEEAERKKAELISGPVPLFDPSLSPAAAPLAREIDPDARPVIFLTSAASARAARKGTASAETGKRVGPGDFFSIQADPDPERGELGAGIAWGLVPVQGSVDSIKRSSLAPEVYRDRYLSEPPPPLDGRGLRPVDPRAWIDLSPGALRAVGAFGDARGKLRAVQAGDTLTCRCSTKDAALGLCHRVWAASLLLEAGWKVILDGEEIEPERSAEILEWIETKKKGGEK